MSRLNTPNTSTPNEGTADQIHHALTEFCPTYVELINESAAHTGYFEGKQSHFKLVVVSECFVPLRLAARHQQIYRALGHLLTQAGGTIHALALHTYTPSEWQALGNAPASPSCQGGHRND